MISALLPRVAANLIGLAYIAAAQDRRDEALAMVEEASAIAEANAAHAIVRRSSRRVLLCRRPLGPAKIRTALSSAPVVSVLRLRNDRMFLDCVGRVRAWPGVRLAGLLQGTTRCTLAQAKGAPA